MTIPMIIPHTTVKIPQIGLGTWQLRGKACTYAVKEALRLGYRHIDTAAVYENESEIGDVLCDFPRETLFITSKAWPKSLTKERLREACAESLKRLKTTYLDLYLLHWPDKTLDYREIFTAFKELHNEKKIRSVGISNFTIHHIKDILPIVKELQLPIVTNQVEYHPFLNQQELLAFCAEHQMSVTAYSPLARGTVFSSSELKKIAEKHGKTIGQITLRWLVQKGMIVIPKASSVQHMEENLDIFDFVLNDEDFHIIEMLNRNERLVNPSFSEFDY